MRTMRVCHLRYTTLTSVPVLGYSVILIELCLYILGLTDDMYLSDKEKKFIRPLLQRLDMRVSKVVAHSFRFGFILRFFSKPIVIDVDDRREYDLVERSSYHFILWSLVHCDDISPNTALLLREYFFNDFGVLF